MLTIEKNSDKFVEDKLVAGQQKLIHCVQKLAKEIRPGMSEKQGTQIVQEILSLEGFGKNWHPHKVRFGANTLKTFSEPSDATITLQDSDIFFLDLGPILADHECDYGETFVVGDNPEYKKLRDTARTLFHRVRDKWKKENLTGVELYDFAVRETQKEGFEFVTRGASGHRIGDFPHHVHYRGNLMDIGDSVLPNHWILEIQIHSKKLDRGAFFEDIL